MDTSVTIHIQAAGFRALFLQRLALLLGATVTVEKSTNGPLTRLIEKGEKDLAEGKGVVLTPDELRAMTNEVA